MTNYSCIMNDLINQSNNHTVLIPSYYNFIDHIPYAVITSL